MEQASVAFSAPGKVLLAGGYLVLDRNYSGLVYGLNARIHVVVQAIQTAPGMSLSEIIVKSPQFRNAEWRYGYRRTENNGGIEVTQLGSPTLALQPRNKFVETSLAYTLTYALAVNASRIGPTSITILADSDYYSYPGPTGDHHPHNADRFVNFDTSLDQAHKTGLGSSAALVTALTAALLSYCIPSTLLEVSSVAGRTRLHNLAQAAHCAAQGKVGSGFDIAAAVYGSCVYRRFSPLILDSLGEIGQTGFLGRLRNVIEDADPNRRWDADINKASASIPSGLRLVMCDVDCGSETVGMVKSVLSWRQSKPAEALILWDTLQKLGEELAVELQKTVPEQPRGLKNYEKLRSIILTIRCLIREMSLKSRVPIEPPIQTALIDACCRLPGVLGGVVPGAGGFDAIALLVEDDDEIVNRLRGSLEGYRRLPDQSGGTGKVRLLSVKQDSEGARAEDVQMYESWKR